jgi:signal transduction histidine kinase
VKSIVERHGGTVAALSDAAGPTRFVVRLPVGGEAAQ